MKRLLLGFFLALALAAPAEAQLYKRVSAADVANALSATPLSPASGGTGVANNAAATLTRSGNHALTLTTAGTTNVTLPTSGTLASLGANTFTGAQTFSAAITYGGVTLTNSVTGTGSMALSASPTFTGTVGAAAVTLSGNLQVPTGANGIFFGGTTSSFAKLSNSGTTVQVLLADGSNFAPLNTGSITANNSINTNSGASINAAGNLTGVAVVASGAVTSSGGTAGIGYATGAGGTVTQATSKSTGVTLSKTSGTITMNGAALASVTSVAFTLTNTAIAATDCLFVGHDSVGTLGGYGITATPAAGSATITVRNNTAGSLSEAIVLRFFVFKCVTS